MAPWAAELEDFVDQSFPEPSGRYKSSSTSSSTGIDVDEDGSEVLEISGATTPAAQTSGTQTPLEAPTSVLSAARRSPRGPLGRAPILRFRGVLILAAVLGVFHTGRRWASEQWGVKPEPVTADPGSDHLDEASRSWMKTGTIYQNDYMTLYNKNDVAISVTLEVLEGDSFKLLVTSLDSIGGGNEGWFQLRGTFATEQVEGQKSMRRIVPSMPLNHKAFNYDPDVLDRACRIAYKCLEKVGVGVTQLEINVNEDEVYVTPRSSIIRLFWDEAVVLRPTPKDKIWTTPSP